MSPQTYYAVLVGPHGQQSSTPTVRIFAEHPTLSDGLGPMTVLGFRQPDAASQVSGVSMLFKPSCATTAYCVSQSAPSGDVSSATFRLALKGYAGTGFGVNAPTALRHPGTYAFLPAMLIDGQSATYHGPPLLMTYLRATRFTEFDVSPEPVRSGRSVTVRGSVMKATACPASGRPAGCRKGQMGRWTPLKRQTVWIYFDPTGPIPANEVARTKTGERGRFSVRVTQRQSGTYHAEYHATLELGESSSRGDRVRVRS